MPGRHDTLFRKLACLTVFASLITSGALLAAEQAAVQRDGKRTVEDASRTLVAKP